MSFLSRGLERVAHCGGYGHANLGVLLQLSGMHHWLLWFYHAFMRSQKVMGSIACIINYIFGVQATFFKGFCL